MTNPAGVLVVTQEPQVARIVTEVVNASTQAASRGVCRNLDDLLITLDRTPVPVVIVDIDPKPDQMLSDLDAIVNRYSSSRFIVLSSEQRSDLVMQAMHVGVRHFMLKDSIRADLMGILQRLMLGGAGGGTSSNGWHGAIVTILSAGGGCGVTTLAINFANELSLLSNHPTLLIDLDCNYGAAAGYLGVTAQYGVADVLADGDRIDAQLVKTTAVAHSEGLHVLVSPATVSIENPARLAYEHLGRALQKGREAYVYTVVDAPRVPIDVAALLAAVSAMTFLVLEMNVEHIRTARAIYGALVGRGIPQDRILPLVSRYRGRREMITMEEAQRAIGCARIGYLSNDYKAVLASVNYGKPLSTSTPKSALRLDIQNLARAVRDSAAPASRVTVER